MPQPSIQAQHSLPAHTSSSPTPSAQETRNLSAQPSMQYATSSSQPPPAASQTTTTTAPAGGTGAGISTHAQLQVLSFYGLTTPNPETWNEETIPTHDSTTHTNQNANSKSKQNTAEINEKNAELQIQRAAQELFNQQDPLQIKENIINNITNVQQTQIASRQFAPKVFLKQVHSDTTYEQLKQGAKKLASSADQRTEILKTVVKSNFEKFVTAKNTVDRVYVDLKSKVLDLPEYGTERFGTILTDTIKKANAIYLPIQQKRSEIDRIHATLGIMDRYRFLFGLPKTLESLVSRRSYEQAVRDYKKGRFIMSTPNANKSSPANPQLVEVLNRAWEQVTIVITGLRSRLFRELDDMSLDFEIQEKNLGYLIDLDSQDDPFIYYMDAISQHIKKTFWSAMLDCGLKTIVCQKRLLLDQDESPDNLNDALHLPIDIQKRKFRDFKKRLSTFDTAEYTVSYAEDPYVSMGESRLAALTQLTRSLRQTLPKLNRISKLTEQQSSPLPASESTNEIVRKISEPEKKGFPRPGNYFKKHKAQPSTGYDKEKEKDKDKDKKKSDHKERFFHSLLSSKEEKANPFAEISTLAAPKSSLPRTSSSFALAISKRNEHCTLTLAKLLGLYAYYATHLAEGSVPSIIKSVAEGILIAEEQEHKAAINTAVEAAQKEKEAIVETTAQGGKKSRRFSINTNAAPRSVSPVAKPPPLVPASRSPLTIGRIKHHATFFTQMPKEDLGFNDVPPSKIDTDNRDSNPLTFIHFYPKCLSQLRDVRNDLAQQDSISDTRDVIRACLMRIQQSSLQLACHLWKREARVFIMYEDWESDIEYSNSTGLVRLFYRFQKAMVRELLRAIDLETHTDSRKILNTAQVDIVREAFLETLIAFLNLMEFIAFDPMYPKHMLKNAQQRTNKGIFNAPTTASGRPHQEYKTWSSDVWIGVGAGERGTAISNASASQRNKQRMLKQEKRWLYVLGTISGMRDRIITKLGRVWGEVVRTAQQSGSSRDDLARGGDILEPEDAGDLGKIHEAADILRQKLIHAFVERKSSAINGAVEIGLKEKFVYVNDEGEPASYLWPAQDNTQPLRDWTMQVILVFVLTHAEISTSLTQAVSVMMSDTKSAYQTNGAVLLPKISLIAQILRKLLRVTMDLLQAKVQTFESFAAGGAAQITAEVNFVYKMIGGQEDEFEQETLLLSETTKNVYMNILSIIEQKSSNERNNTTYKSWILEATRDKLQQNMSFAAVFRDIQ